MEETRIIGGKKYIFSLQPCRACGKKRFIRKSLIGKNTGLCRSCAWKKEHITWGFPKGEKHPDWLGGFKRSTGGYIMQHAPLHPNADRKGYVYQHRLVMEKVIGRSLQPFIIKTESKMITAATILNYGTGSTETVNVFPI